MRKLTRLWQTFERVPGLAAIPAAWEHHCGSDYPVIQPFLRPTDMTGAAYPCADCPAKGCSREIIDYGGGGLLAVCRERWNRGADIAVKHSDAVLQAVELVSFTKAIAGPLGLRWQHPVARGHGTWGIGFLPVGYGVEQQVILMVHTEQERFRHALNALLTETTGHFVLLSPTVLRRDLGVHETLARREVRFRTLDDHVGASEAAALVALRPLFPEAATTTVTPVPLRAETVKLFLAKHKLTIKEVVAALGLDYRDFKRWRKGELEDTSSKSRRIEAYLQSGPGTAK